MMTLTPFKGNMLLKRNSLPRKSYTAKDRKVNTYILSKAEKSKSPKKY